MLVLPEVIPAELKKEGDGKKVSGVFGNVHHPDNRKCGEELYARLTEWLEKGIIKVGLSILRCSQGSESRSC